MYFQPGVLVLFICSSHICFVACKSRFIAYKSIIKQKSKCYSVSGLQIVSHDLNQRWSGSVISSVRTGQVRCEHWVIDQTHRSQSVFVQRLPLCCYFIPCLWIYDSEEQDKILKQMHVRQLIETVTCSYIIPRYLSKW